MGIGIDISQIIYQGTGVATYTENLVANLLARNRANRYVLFGSSFGQHDNLKILSQYLCSNDLIHSKSKIFSLPPVLLDFLWNRWHVFSVENFVGKIDVFHSSDWLQPPARCPKVTTIHDLVVLKFPQSAHPKIVAVQKRKLDWARRECDLLIAVSEATKNDICRLLRVPEQKIRVIYEGPSAGMANFGKLPAGEKRERVKVIKDKYQLADYILAVGAGDPRKNLSRLIEAFTKVENLELQLAVAGKVGWGTPLTGGQTANRLKFLGYVPPEDLPALYAGAAVLVYPSLYEGFGIPVLDALTVGCPVITSQGSSLLEIGGKAAFYVDPTKVTDIAEKIGYVLSLPQRKRANVLRVGYSQAEKYSWDKAARETAAVYEELG